MNFLGRQERNRNFNDGCGKGVENVWEKLKVYQELWSWKKIWNLEIGSNPKVKKYEILDIATFLPINFILPSLDFPHFFIIPSKNNFFPSIATSII